MLCLVYVKALNSGEDGSVICTFKVETLNYEDDLDLMEWRVCKIVDQKIDTKNYKILDEADTSITKFEIEGNGFVKFLPTNIGEVFPMLLVLEVESCAIESIKADVFEGLETLQTLNLRSNQISNVDENAFEKLTTLRELNLIDNSLTHLPPKLFATLVNLESLILSNNNVQELDENLLSNLVNLVDFIMFTNRLSTVPENLFANNKNLQTISFGQNQIRVLGVTLFNDLPYLTGVDLADNLCVNTIYESTSQSLQDFQDFVNHRCQPSAKIISAKATETPPAESSAYKVILESFGVLLTSIIISTTFNF